MANRTKLLEIGLIIIIFGISQTYNRLCQIYVTIIKLWLLAESHFFAVLSSVVYVHS